MDAITEIAGNLINKILDIFNHTVFGQLGELFSMIRDSFKGSIDFFVTVFKVLPSLCFNVSSMLPPPLNYLLISFIGFLVLVVLLKLVTLILEALPVV